jgi:hypothetical protein
MFARCLLLERVAQVCKPAAELWPFLEILLVQMLFASSQLRHLFLHHLCLRSLRYFLHSFQLLPQLNNQLTFKGRRRLFRLYDPRIPLLLRQVTPHLDLLHRPLCLQQLPRTFLDFQPPFLLFRLQLCLQFFLHLFLQPRQRLYLHLKCNIAQHFPTLVLIAASLFAEV